MLFEPKNIATPQPLTILESLMPTAISPKAKQNRLQKMVRQLRRSSRNRRLGRLGITLLVSKKTIFTGLGRSLGQGTFGKVRVGTHTITGEKVAIKILEKDRIESKSDVERVTREINILKKVRHPNVI
jgi:hypothetical protein